MSSVESLALALLVSQHTTDLNRQALTEELNRLAAENAKLRAEQRAAAPKAKKGKAPIHQAPGMKGVLRNPTVESATTYLSSARRARTRDESIAAIDLFVGYDRSGNFGDQDVRARMLAQSTLKPIVVTGPTREEQRSAANSLKGFVSGLPDHQAKMLANLQAQEERVAADLIDYRKAGNEVAARLEEERLAHVRQQIAAMGF